MTKPINTVTNLDINALRRAQELAVSATAILGQKAGDGAKARPTVAQLNSTMDNLGTISDLLGYVLRDMVELPNIEHASDVERRIVGRLVTDLLAAGFQISIDDGGGLAESPLVRSTDANAIFGALSSTDSDRLYVSKKGEHRFDGWVYLVWGNDDAVISDYTTNLDQYLAAANKLAEELEA